jgi:ElaB/YqjD/DUF883 family membrane-anchored ribosome-binding protein
MDMNRTSDVLPSGYEVESASFNMPVAGEVMPCGCAMSHEHHHHHDHTHLEANGGLKSKVDDLKARALTTAETVKEQASVKMAELKSNLNTTMASVKANVNEKLAEGRVVANRTMTEAQTEAKIQYATMQTSMRTSPMKWAGIAGGTGLVIGLIGRYMSYRAKQRSRMPQLVIIEHAC